jgi:hypothetical protein
MEFQHYFNSMSDNFVMGLAGMFAEKQIAVMEILPSQARQEIKKEALSLLDSESLRRELVMKSTGNTPRSYDSVSRDTIKAKGNLIPSFFESPAVLSFLSLVAGEKLHPVPYEPEEYIINRQHKPNDTHGWHWDDYIYALVWVVESPDPFLGGRVEIIPNNEWDKKDTHNQMRTILAHRKVSSYYVREGCCYLLKARYVLHRVAPLTGKTNRTVIVFSYASEKDLIDPKISHETMEAIYSPEISGTRAC